MKTSDKNTGSSRLSRVTLIFGFIFYAFAISISATVFASSTNGTINATNRYAYMESGSWLDFGSSQGAVTITDSALAGYAWSPEFGWLSLNCSNDDSCSTSVNYKVANDGNGVLSGYSWSETAGWIDWKPTNGGVTIDSSGVFSGRAWGDQIGWVTFNCSADNSCAAVDYKVSTDWRPQSARPQCNNTLDDDGDGKIDYPADSGCSSATDNDETDPVSFFSSGGRAIAAIISVPQNIISNIIEAITPEFLKPKGPVTEAVPEIQVPKTAPLALQGEWRLLPVNSISDFVFAPLPQGIRVLATKFSSFGKMLNEVGVTRLSDMDKLQGVSLSLPGLTERSGISAPSVHAGALSAMAGVPIAKLSASNKQALPSETIFARVGGELIDLNASVVVSDVGDVSQKISTESGQTIRLAIKPESAAASVKGYLSFNKRNALSKETEYSNNMLASVISALPVLGKKANSAPIEDKLVLLSFDYNDSDKDGIWTADIQSPVVAGEYEVMTIIAYKDPELGTRQVRLVTVVDPEGYVYEKNGSKETRVPDAIVSMYALNSANGQYEMWPATTYHQENPQTTGVSGTYSFLVPPGTYRVSVTAPGYIPYDGKPFDVQVGGGVHQNIELIPKNVWLKVLDWKIFLIIIVVLLLAYNFYRDWRRGGKNINS
jgi:hypothetical protein